MINGQSIIDNKGQSTDARVKIEWGDDGSLSFTVVDDIGGSITVYAVFNVRQEGCTGRDDPNNINLALEEPTKTVTITGGTEQEAPAAVAASLTDTQKEDSAFAAEESDKESEEEIEKETKEDPEAEPEEEAKEEPEAEPEEGAKEDPETEPEEETEEESEIASEEETVG